MGDVQDDHLSLGRVLKDMQAKGQPGNEQPVPFTIDPVLLRDILAALAFLWHDELPEAVYVSLADPSEAMLRALSRLVGIRRGAA